MHFISGRRGRRRRGGGIGWVDQGREARWDWVETAVAPKQPVPCAGRLGDDEGGLLPASPNLPPLCHLARYTPISPPDAKGHFDLAIKVYKGEKPGKVSSHFDSLKIGDSVDFKVGAHVHDPHRFGAGGRCFPLDAWPCPAGCGPWRSTWPPALPSIPSLGPTPRPKPRRPQGPLPKLALKDIASKKAVGMVAGGTGLTPMLQVIDEALRQGLPTKFSFIFANVSEDDIIMKQHLDDLAAKHENLSIHYGACWIGTGGELGAGLCATRLCVHACVSCHPAHAPGCLPLWNVGAGPFWGHGAEPWQGTWRRTARRGVAAGGRWL